MTNATNSAKRWYHPAGQPGRARRLIFISAHLTHLAAIGFLVLPFAEHALSYRPWMWFLGNLILLYVLAVVIECTPLDIQRPMAFAAVLTAIFANLILFPTAVCLGYFVPLFYIKLPLCYLPLEAAWQTRPPAPPVNMRRREPTHVPPQHC